MKKITSFTVSVLFAIGLSLTTQAQLTVPSGDGGSGQQFIDAETMAQGFLAFDSTFYKVLLQSQQDNGSYYGVNMVMDGNLFVTNMTVNGTNVPLPEPAAGIPVPDEGFQNVSVQVTAFDKYGNTASMGQTNYPLLAQGTLITVIMSPQFPPTAIQIEKGLDQNSITVSLTGANGGWGWSYDPSTGLLTIQVWDPSTTDIGYEVIDSSGGLLAHGQLPFFQSIPGAGTDTNSVFNFHNAGGYINMPLGTNGYNCANSAPFDSTVMRDGQYVPAKVIGVPDVGYQSKLSVWANPYFTDGTTNKIGIEVRKWAATGPMELVPSYTTTDSYGDTHTVTSNYVGRVVVTVLPGEGSTKFFLDIGRTY